jgi:hypothetical protein
MIPEEQNKVVDAWQIKIRKSNIEIRKKLSNLEFRKSSLRVADVMYLDAFGQQTFTTALPPPRQDRATAFSTHPGTKTVLTFSCSLRRLVSPFHKSEQDAGAI